MKKQLRFLHWFMAIFYVVLFATGLTMVNKNLDVELASSLFKFHKSLGVIVMFLLTARILVLLRTVRPKWPLPTAAVQTVLYVAMVIVPLSGYFYSNTAGKPVLVFGLPMPTLFPENRLIKDFAGNVHGWLAYTFAAFVLMHLLTHRQYVQRRLQRL